MYILGPERVADVAGAFVRYKKYLHRNRKRFPSSALSLATSDWYFGFSEHQAPHDAWLESVQITEPATGKRRESRSVSLSIKLLGAYHDGFIEFVYPNVLEYQLSGVGLDRGHGDWRYDEFRVNKRGLLVHKIEWASYGSGHRWVIVADDVIHKWTPFAVAQQAVPADANAVASRHHLRG